MTDVDASPPIAPATPAEAAAAASVEAHAPYMKVLLGLFLLTVGEYFFARFLQDSPAPLMFGLVMMAAAKAGLVAWYFMHLKFERLWVFLVIGPAALMAVILTLMLFPDFVWQPDPLGEPVPAASNEPPRPGP
ncbi:cytochrome C oxidase subunit IV family protein [Paludisphaera sp.]|uniref:cytochrome C oxidase subunit IV family protein n=1 Tax=Paludisphaera sp. TaxID=2017432 RepID=UPI00301C4763